MNPAKAGPFNLGYVVVRARIEVNPETAALTVTTDNEGPYKIPTIIDGIPLQIKHVNVDINRPGFTFNPTNCSPLQITGSLASTEGATSALSVPFQVTNCAVLAFKPKLTVSTSGKTSRVNGASLTVKLGYPAGPYDANISKVKVELPKALPSRLTTLQKACAAAVFDANPAACPPASVVGHATATTPELPVPLSGPAYFVSHGGEAFPSLIIVLQGYGVTVHLVGSTFINKAGITSSTFKTVPDAPVGSFELTLPQGPDSALAANGNLCKEKLAMPTEFVGQNGALIKTSTKIAVTGCPKAKHKAKKASLTSAGRRRGSTGGRSRGGGEMAVSRSRSVAPREGPASARVKPTSARVKPEGSAGVQVAQGTHGRAGVGEIQRARIVAAMGALVRECGAGGVAVAHVVARSGVSRRTFYELFDDREDCFLAVFDIAVARAAESVIPAYEAATQWRVRVRGALEALLVFLDAEPELGYLCVVGALGGGARAMERRTSVVRALVDVVHGGRRESRSVRRPNRLVAEGVVGAVLSVIHARLVEQSVSPAGNGAASVSSGATSGTRAASTPPPSKPLAGLLNPLMGMIVLPYLGAAATERELRRPAPRARRPAAPRIDPLRELDMRLTYRTVRVLLAIASKPDSSNRQVATAAGIADQGQISKLLARLYALGLIQNAGGDHAKGEANAWSLTSRGNDITHTIQIQTG